MADINITKDCKLIKVIADQAMNKCNDGDAIREASDIMKELAEDLSPKNRHMIAQTMAYTLTEVQQNALDFLGQVADQKDVGIGDKAVFQVKNANGIKVVFHAKGGSTVPRSYVGERQVTVDTDEIAARPAINIYDLRTGRVNMADLVAEANRVMTMKKLERVERVLQDAISKYASPFYATGTGINKALLDKQINYFRRLGPVNIIGDIAAVSQLAPIVGMVMNSTPTTQFSNEQINELNDNGFIGRYNGSSVVALANAYADGSTTPVLKDNWLYILPGSMSAEARNLKIVNEGPVNALEAQDINDMVFEVRLDQAFGCAFVTGHNPTIGAYNIN